MILVTKKAVGEYIKDQNGLVPLSKLLDACGISAKDRAKEHRLFQVLGKLLDVLAVYRVDVPAKNEYRFGHSSTTLKDGQLTEPAYYHCTYGYVPEDMK